VKSTSPLWSERCLAGGQSSLVCPPRPRRSSKTAEDLRHFRSRLTELLAAIRNAGYRTVHVFPATSLALSVEFGRQLLPKADAQLEIWDYQQGQFVRTLRLKV
jgi:hypothetical protein